MVTGCWQCGQFRVAVGSSGSRTAAGCREDGPAGGGGSSTRGRHRGWWCLAEAAGPFLVQGLVAAVLGFTAADH